MAGDRNSNYKMHALTQMATHLEQATKGPAADTVLQASKHAHNTLLHAIALSALASYPERCCELQGSPMQHVCCTTPAISCFS